MHRFFVRNDNLRAKEVLLNGEIAYQIGRVLRMRPGDEVTLLDGKGYEYRVRLTTLGKDAVAGEVIHRQWVNAEPGHPVTLYLSLLNKPDKFEWALQKCTELGAACFVPLVTQRSVAGAPAAGRRERWERIIREAAEQSGRGVLPILEDAVALGQALDKERVRLQEDKHIALMPALGADMSLEEALAGMTAREGTVSLFIGPEGGFTDDELFEANLRGVLLVNLGPRTLRAETAAVAALTIVLYELGEMGAGVPGD